MEIIRQAKELCGKEKVAVDKKADKASRKEAKETNRAIERAEIIMEDLNKFSTPAGKKRLAQAEKDLSDGPAFFYENAKELLSEARLMPTATKEEKEIRSDAIKNARIKKEAASLIRKYGAEKITPPDESVKEEILTRTAKTSYYSG